MYVYSNLFAISGILVIFYCLPYFTWFYSWLLLFWHFWDVLFVIVLFVFVLFVISGISFVVCCYSWLSVFFLCLFSLFQCIFFKVIVIFRWYGLYIIYNVWWYVHWEIFAILIIICVGYLTFVGCYFIYHRLFAIHGMFIQRFCFCLPFFRCYLW